MEFSSSTLVSMCGKHISLCQISFLKIYFSKKFKSQSISFGPLFTHGRKGVGVGIRSDPVCVPLLCPAVQNICNCTLPPSWPLSRLLISPSSVTTVYHRIWINLFSLINQFNHIVYKLKVVSIIIRSYRVYGILHGNKAIFDEGFRTLLHNTINTT